MDSSQHLPGPCGMMQPKAFGDTRWAVLQIKPNQERRLASDLVRLDVRVFLPLEHRLTISFRHRRWHDFPLFPGYLFADADRMGDIAVASRRRVIGVLPVYSQCDLTADLERIRLACELNPSPYRRLVEGTEVEVIAGPLMGLSGTVVYCDGITKLVLMVRMLGQAVSVDIDPANVRVVEKTVGPSVK